MTFKLLPTSESKRSTHINIFVKSIVEQNQFRVNETTFYRWWEKFCLEIVTKPMSDLSEICWKNFTNATSDATHSEEKIGKIVQAMTMYLFGKCWQRKIILQIIYRQDTTKWRDPFVLWYGTVSIHSTQPFSCWSNLLAGFDLGKLAHFSCSFRIGIRY